MKDNKIINKWLTYIIASVWLINGLYCKVLNLTPRHEEIVAKILNTNYSKPLIILIGLSEIIMALWIVSKFKSKINAITQIIIIALMNILELVFASELLLWGSLNILFAFLFILVIYFNEFHWNLNDNRNA